MPPADEPQPSLDELDQIVAWIEKDFLAAQCAKQQSSAPVVIRRLNRQEYNNTIRDLLGLDLHLADAFPAGRYRLRLRQRRLRAQHLAGPCREVPRRRRTGLAEGDRACPTSQDFSPAELIGLKTYPLPPNARGRVQALAQARTVPGRLQPGAGRDTRIGPAAQDW